MIEVTESLFVTTCLFAASPTTISPSLNATTEGVVLSPSELPISVGVGTTTLVNDCNSYEIEVTEMPETDLTINFRIEE